MPKRPKQALIFTGTNEPVLLVRQASKARVLTIDSLTHSTNPSIVPHQTKAEVELEQRERRESRVRHVSHDRHDDDDGAAGANRS